MALRINVDANLLCSAGNATVSISPFNLGSHLNVWFVPFAGVVSKSETITFDAMWGNTDYCGDRNRLEKSGLYLGWFPIVSIFPKNRGDEDRPSVKCQYPFKYRFSLVYRKSQTPVTYLLQTGCYPTKQPRQVA